MATNQATRSPGGTSASETISHGTSPAPSKNSQLNIHELYQQRSSFGGRLEKHRNEHQHNSIFDNLRAVLDSPTASTTTYSSDNLSGSRSNGHSPTTPFTPAGGTPGATSQRSSPNGSIIDPIGALLGFHQEFLDESSDDEREWNPSFSLDELDDRKVDNLESVESSGHSTGLKQDYTSAALGAIPATHGTESQGKGDILKSQQGESSDVKKESGLTNSDFEDAWDEEEYRILNSSVNKRNKATANALAMKERASSAFVANAHQAKASVNGLKNIREARKTQQNQRQCEFGIEPERTKTMTDNDDDNLDSPVSGVNNWFEAKDSSIHQNAVATTSSGTIKKKRSPFKSKISSKMSAASDSKARITSKLSANVLSMKDKTSSALSQKTQRAKAKTVGMVLATSSPMLKQRKEVQRKTQQGLLTLQVDASTRLGVIAPYSIYTTPDAIYRKGISAQVIGTPADDDSLPGESFHATLGSPTTPLPLSPCLTHVSLAQNSVISCIDENGFMISPASLATEVGSPNVAEIEPEESLDPNSFIFMSPLSNVDMGDDYGMPEILAQSNACHAHSVLGSFTGPGEMSKPKSIEIKPKLLPRLPPSPCLPPSGKKIAKKMKGLRKRNSDDGKSNADKTVIHAPMSGIKPAMERPPLCHRRLRSF